MRTTGVPRGFPLAFLGYGFLYAFGYISWSTESLSTIAVSAGGFDLSWLVSAITVPAVLAALALASFKCNVERCGALYAAAPLAAALGSVLSVVYQHVPHTGASACLAVASGLLTGSASGLFSVLWSAALSHLAMGALEIIAPASFCVSLLCALFVPALPQVSALCVALLVVAACGGCLALCRRQLAEGRVAQAWLDDGAAEQVPGEGRAAGAAGRAQRGVPGIARMLLFAVLAWSLMNVVPIGTGEAATLIAGIDVVGALGYALAIALALAIIRYAVRVDFQALASMTLPLFVLSTTLFALESAGSVFAASVVNVALNSCCEIILVLYFIRIAQARPERRVFWLGLGSAASYTGVLLGQLGELACMRAGVVENNLPLFCLVVVCAYTFAMLLIPQRTYEKSAGVSADAGAASMKAPACTRPNAEGGAAAKGESSQTPHDRTAAACAAVAREFALSAREAEVCEMLARGRSQTYIRDALFLSKNTVATHTRRLYAKTGVHSKQELIDLVESRVEG